jgi:hypothetical protein
MAEPLFSTIATPPYDCEQKIKTKKEERKREEKKNRHRREKKSRRKMCQDVCCGRHLPKKKK